jgi:hypothetical protein
MKVTPVARAGSRRDAVPSLRIMARHTSITAGGSIPAQTNNILPLAIF